MNIKYPLLIPSIGHGATDLIEYPIQAITLNFFSAILVYNCNLFFRKAILVVFSIFHLSEDIPNKIKFNSNIFNVKNKKLLLTSLFHGIMIKKPLIAKLYFLLIHTPLHYLRIVKTQIKVKEKIILGLFTSLISMILLNKDYDIMLENKMNKLWWIFPILPHILLTHKFNENYIKNKIKHKKNIIIKIDNIYVI